MDLHFIRRVFPKHLILFYHFLLAHLAAFIYRYPSRQLVVIGVTGTNGKSTTTQFIGRILEHAGARVGWTTTVSFKVAQDEWINDQKMTMLGRFQTQKLLRRMVRTGCEYAIIETSSQGIEQFRHIGINYDLLVFTNLTPEHIEAHGGFENYKKAKGKLFKQLAHLPRKKIGDKIIEKTIVVNLMDPHADYFLSFAADRYSGFALENPGALATRLNMTPLVAAAVVYSGNCTIFSVGTRTFHLKPIGQFYLENALAAMSAVKALGIEEEVIHHAVESLAPVAGRLERIDEEQSFIVIIDYAPEPAALIALYESLKLVAHKRLIHVLGSCGGGRDRARRNVLGRMAAEHAQIVIVTNEDPYDDDPGEIIDDVAHGAQETGKQEGVNLFRILDRQEAIQMAINFAQPDDLVLITGKGCEPVMAVAHGKKIPWDDRAVVRSILHKKYASAQIS